MTLADVHVREACRLDAAANRGCGRRRGSEQLQLSAWMFHRARSVTLHVAYTIADLAVSERDRA